MLRYLTAAVALVATAGAGTGVQEADARKIKVEIESVSLNGRGLAAAGGGNSVLASFNAVLCWPERNDNREHLPLLTRLGPAGSFQGAHRFTCSPSDGSKTGTAKVELGPFKSAPRTMEYSLQKEADRGGKAFAEDERPTFVIDLGEKEKLRRTFVQILAHDVDALSGDDLFGIVKTSDVVASVGKTISSKMYLFEYPTAVGKSARNFHYAGSIPKASGTMKYRMTYVEDEGDAEAPSTAATTTSTPNAEE